MKKFRYLMFLLLFSLVPGLSFGQLAYVEKFHDYSSSPEYWTALNAIDAKLRDHVNTAASFLVFFKINDDRKKMRYSHAISFSSLSERDCSFAMDAILTEKGEIEVPVLISQQQGFLVLPVSINHPVTMWNHGAPTEFRNSNKAFETLRLLWENTPESILPAYYTGERYVYLISCGTSSGGG